MDFCPTPHPLIPYSNTSIDIFDILISLCLFRLLPKYFLMAVVDSLLSVKFYALVYKNIPYFKKLRSLRISIS